jgi:hypothetical protein
MDNQFFEKPILNAPYEYPARHWELDKDGQPIHDNPEDVVPIGDRAVAADQ